MKKSLVAVGVIVALGVVWSASAWYTGKQLEQHISQAVTEANQQMQQLAPAAGLKLAYENYHRGVFSSQLQLVITPDPVAKNSWLKPGQSVVLDENVDHGPFPFAQLKKANLVPAMASIHTQLHNNDTSKKLFEMSGGRSFLDAETRVGYSDANASDIALRPINWAQGDNKLTFSGATISTHVDSDADAVKVSGETGSGQFTTKNEYGQQVQLAFSGLKSEGNTTVSKFKERVGEQKIALEKLTIALEGKEIALLKGLTIGGHTTPDSDGKHLNAQLDYTLDALHLQNQNLGQGKMTLKVSHLDGDALHQFTQRYNAQVGVLMADPKLAEDPQAQQEKAMAILRDNLPVLLKGNPVITIEPLSWKNDKGESALNLTVGLKAPQQQQPQTPQDSFANVVNTIDGKLSIPMPMATELMTSVAKLEGYQGDQASKLASQQVQGVAAMGQMFRLTTTENETIGSTLHYADGNVTLNGQAMTLSDFLGMFGLNLAPGPQLAPEANTPETPTPVLPLR